MMMMMMMMMIIIIMEPHVTYTDFHYLAALMKINDTKLCIFYLKCIAASHEVLLWYGPIGSV